MCVRKPYTTISLFLLLSCYSQTAQYLQCNINCVRKHLKHGKNDYSQSLNPIINLQFTCIQTSRCHLLIQKNQRISEEKHKEITENETKQTTTKQTKHSNF